MITGQNFFIIFNFSEKNEIILRKNLACLDSTVDKFRCTAGKFSKKLESKLKYSIHP